MKRFPAFGILFGSRSRLGDLRAFLEANSGLPGPRSNLELGAAFADALAHMRLQEWQWEFLLATARTPARKAPENTPALFPVFCCLLALGSQCAAGLPRARRRAALAAIRAAAGDERWRVREGAAMALQRIGEQDAEALKETLREWQEGASWLEMRALAAALAHPPILTPELADFSFDAARRILSAMSRAPAAERRGEAYRTLRQGMGYALSVFAAASPAAGFTFLRKSAAIRDADVAWIVRENLRKKRVSGPFAAEVGQVSAILEEVNRGHPGAGRRR